MVRGYLGIVSAIDNYGIIYSLWYYLNRLPPSNQSPGPSWSLPTTHPSPPLTSILHLTHQTDLSLNNLLSNHPPTTIPNPLPSPLRPTHPRSAPPVPRHPLPRLLPTIALNQPSLRVPTGETHPRRRCPVGDCSGGCCGCGGVCIDKAVGTEGGDGVVEGGVGEGTEGEVLYCSCGACGCVLFWGVCSCCAGERVCVGGGWGVWGEFGMGDVVIGKKATELNVPGVVQEYTRFGQFDQPCFGMLCSSHPTSKRPKWNNAYSSTMSPGNEAETSQTAGSTVYSQKKTPSGPSAVSL